jgi:hypothetical protein
MNQSENITKSDKFSKPNYPDELLQRLAELARERSLFAKEHSSVTTAETMRSGSELLIVQYVCFIRRMMARDPNNYFLLDELFDLALNDVHRWIEIADQRAFNKKHDDPGTGSRSHERRGLRLVYSSHKQ